MNSMYQLLALVGAGLIGWVLYRTVKNKPEQFSRENLKKSFSSMGFLALILIAFVSFLVLITRQ
jgi:hypothetical protein